MQNKLALLEAVLFTTNEPLTIEQLEKTTKIRREELEKLIGILRIKYSTEDSGVRLSEAGGFRLVVKPEYVEKVSHLTPHADLSRGLLRVLSIIAYHEPISQADIVKVIGNRTYEYTKELESRGLIKSEKKSRTKLLRTTPHFEEYFGAGKEKIREMIKDMENEHEKEKPGQTAEADTKMQ